MTSHARFMTSQHSIHYIILLYIIWNWLYLTAHPLYLCHHTQIIDLITPITCMIIQEQYIWIHMTLFMISHHAMTSHTLHSCHHTKDTWHRIHCSQTFTYSLLIIPQLLYMWHVLHCMHDIIWILLTSQPLFMTSQDCIHDITSTLFMTSNSLYMTSHTLYLWHNSHSNYDNTATIFLTLYSVYMTPQILNEWYQKTVSDMISNVSV